MKKSDGFNIFKQAPNWPSIPPWWTLTSPQVAALLNITPETLHIKRAQGVAPQSISAEAFPETTLSPEARNRDLGWMLYDIDYANGRSSAFFQAKMENGVVDVANSVRKGLAT